MSTTEYRFGDIRTSLDSFTVRAPYNEEEAAADFELSLETGWRLLPQERRVDVRLACAWESSLKIENVDPIVMRCVLISSIEVVGLFTEMGPTDEHALPVGLKATLLGIALGTLRGVVKTRSEGFAVSSVELPVFNPTELLAQATPS